MIDIHKIKGYLGYGIKVSLKYENSDEIHTVLLDTEIAGICKCYNLGMDYLIDFEVEYYKLHLRSIDDLTLEKDWDLIEWLCDEEFGQIMSLEQLKKELKEDTYNLKYNTYEKLYSEHIDIFDLIGQGLAIKKV